MGVLPIPRQQFLVRAFLQNYAFIEHDDVVGDAHGGEAVRNDDGDAVGGQLAEMREDVGLGLGIDGSSGFVENQYVSVVAHEGPSQSDLLPLATGELLAALEPGAELGVVVLRQVLDEIRREPVACSRFHLRTHLHVVHVTDADVVVHLELVAAEVLKDHADLVAQRLDVPLLQIQPFQQNAAAGR